MNRNAVYREAAQTFGRSVQLTVAVEELSELQKEICKTLRGNCNRAHLVEEFADVRIMLEQIQLLFRLDEEDIEEAMCVKVRRLQNRIAEAKQAVAKCGEDFEW